MPPDCTIYTDLPYSIHAFEHLEGMKDREKLTGTPELGLKNAITYQDNVDEYGHRIYEAFKQVRILTLKAPRKTASENVVCLCRLLNLADFSNLF